MELVGVKRMEQLPNFEIPDDPDDETEYGFEYEGHEYIFNKYNTIVYLYKEKYVWLNHVYHQPNEGAGVYWFESEPLIDELVERDFDQVFIGVKPAQQDLDAYARYIHQKFEEEFK